MRDWRILHKQIMVDFIAYLNSVSDKFVLKGGTSLMFCYGLTRFSEDIDLDGMDKKFFSYVDQFIIRYRPKYGELTYRKAKDTDTCKRVFIHFGQEKPLKVEVSYRDRVDICFCTYVNGILVYDIESLMIKKINAFSHRDKIRDLYDVTFIYWHYKNQLGIRTIQSLRDVVAFKGLEQFDFLIKDQRDPLINNNELAEAFLSMYFDLGLS